MLHFVFEMWLRGAEQDSPVVNNEHTNDKAEDHWEQEPWRGQRGLMRIKLPLASAEVEK